MISRILAVFIIVFFAWIPAPAQELKTPFELSGKKATATYAQCRDWYKAMQANYPGITYFDSMGYSDGGFPIYIFRIYSDKNTRPIKVLVMNNIHPGEPEGTDASMLLVKEILEDQKKWREVLEHVDLHIICQYNTDGTINRGCCTRANQDGPEELGFRANAKNLDLNRDFIKLDSRNARHFTQYFVKNKFDIFIDNHTSNGADYQYTLTYFHTRPEKLDATLVPFMHQISTGIEKQLGKRNIPTSPYVDTRKIVPDSGILAFWESPRFSTGFAALHHCIGFTVETHMLKPFPARVEVTRAFMEELLKRVCEKNIAEGLYDARRKLIADARIGSDNRENIAWKLDETRSDIISFRGYEFSYKMSSVTGLPRLFYDRNKPWEKNISYYHYYIPTDSIVLPRAYIIPAAWHEVVDRLRWNGVHLKQIPNDTFMPVRASYILSYETVKNPYESHYMHYNTITRDTTIRVQLRAGDYYAVVTNTNRIFLAATLEPRSQDSYFNWNYFDGILQQKEGFSDYVFADKAEEILMADTALKTAFENWKRNDSSVASNSWAQLAWIYRHSVYYEKSHNRYPVYRMD